MYCEKLKVTPGSAVRISFSSCVVNVALVTPRGQSSKGFNGTNSSTFENGEGSLPLSGRPCWEITVTISGWLSRISRILRVASVPASKVMLGGSEARIQKFLSSQAGRNSLPKNGIKG